MNKESKELLKELIKIASVEYPEIEINGEMIDAQDIFFEEKVKMNCFYCGKYNGNWKCPPNLPLIDYKKMVNEYTNIALIYVKVPMHSKLIKDPRSESSLMLHKILLKAEKILWERNYPMAISFIGGSCKLCKNGCGAEHCNNPYMARTPVEATGINIVATAGKYGIDITFPPKEYMMRIGMLLW